MQKNHLESLTNNRKYSMLHTSGDFCYFHSNLFPQLVTRSTVYPQSDKKWMGKTKCVSSLNYVAYSMGSTFVDRNGDNTQSTEWYSECRWHYDFVVNRYWNSVIHDDKTCLCTFFMRSHSNPGWRISAHAIEWHIKCYIFRISREWKFMTSIRDGSVSFTARN